MRELIHAIIFMSFLGFAFGLASHSFGITDYVLDKLDQDIKTSTTEPRYAQMYVNENEAD